MSAQYIEQVLASIKCDIGCITWCIAQPLSITFALTAQDKSTSLLDALLTTIQEVTNTAVKLVALEAEIPSSPFLHGGSRARRPGEETGPREREGTSGLKQHGMAGDRNRSLQLNEKFEPGLVSSRVWISGKKNYLLRQKLLLHAEKVVFEYEVLLIVYLNNYYCNYMDSIDKNILNWELNFSYHICRL